MTPTLTYRESGAGVRVDLDRLVASRMLVQANSGGGKSRAIRQLLEETYGRIPHLVIDPEGEFATVREKFGYVLAAKQGGEALAAPRTAKVLCRRLVELGASAVLDLYELRLDERREFVSIFLTELVNLPRALWRPILVIIDEAHVFAPQQGESEALQPVIGLCTLGRKRGFAAVLATQRISKLHKDAAAELLNKMIGRTGLDVDVKRAGDELGFDKEGRQDLPRLEPGEFFVYGPAISPVVTKVRTGAVTTTHPEPGQVSAAPPPAPTAIRAMLAQLADLPKEAEQEARTIEDLKRDNAKLRGELTRAQRAQPAPITKTVEKPVVDQRAVDKAVATAVMPYRKLIGRVQLQMNGVIQAVKLLPDRLEAVVVTLGEVEKMNGHHTVERSSGAGMKSAAAAPIGAGRLGATDERAQTATRQQPVPASGLPKGQQKILNALAELEAVGVNEPSRAQLGMFAGYNLTGGTGGQHIADLNGLMLVDLPNKGTVRLTDAGRAAADPSAPPSTLNELHERMLAKLDSGPKKILEHLISLGGEAISRAELGAEVNYNLTGGTGGQHIADLVTMGAAVIPSTGKVAAAKILFPEALV